VFRRRRLGCAKVGVASRAVAKAPWPHAFAALPRCSASIPLVGSDGLSLRREAHYDVVFGGEFAGFGAGNWCEVGAEQVGVLHVARHAVGGILRIALDVQLGGPFVAVPEL